MKCYKNRNLSIILAISLCILTIKPSLAFADSNNEKYKVHIQGYNNEFKEYLKDVKNGDTEKYDGLIPIPHNFEGTKITTKDNKKLPSSYSSIKGAAASYDPRILNRVTPVRNQENLSTCWDFAAMAALEAYLKVNNYGDYDLSEEHLKWWAIDDGLYSGWKIDDEVGASNFTSVGYFASGDGPKLEKDIPYNGIVSKKQGAKIPANMDTAQTQINVTDIICTSKDMTSVKNAIMQYGGIISGYCMDDKYLNDSGTANYCNDITESTNHAITIVGWNDNYSKNNFGGEDKPNKDGAWLIKNSWGPDAGDNGYLWISYEDKTLMKDLDNFAIRKVRKPDSNTKVYQHEKATLTSLEANEIMAANVFDFSRKNEVLDSVMFFSDSIGGKYEIYYSPVINGVPQSTNVKMLKSGTIDYSGYITVNTNSFNLPPGKGAIVVKITSPTEGSDAKLGIELTLDGYYDSKAKVGESYSYNGHRFEDINEPSDPMGANLAIKAITKSINVEAKDVIEGSNRYETATKLSQKGWQKSDNIVLVNSNSIVDALSATPYAKAVDAPVLLTGKTDLDNLSKAEIKRLAAKKVYLIGGMNSISSNVEKSIKNMGISTERIAGNDRYETSLKLAQKQNNIGQINDIVVVNGVKGLPDAISVGAAAAQNNMPIILTDNNSNMDYANNFLKGIDIKKSYIVGGNTVLSANLEKKLVNPKRLAGINRNETNSKIINEFYKGDTAVSSLENLFVVKNGIKKQDDLIDGLAVGSLAAKTKSPVILVGDKLDDSQKYVVRNKSFVNIIRVGGNGNELAFEEIKALKK